MNKWQQQVYDMLRAASRNNLPCTIPADVTHIPANMMLEADKAKWISVKKKQPEKNGMYLAHLVHSYSNEDGYSYVTVCFFNPNARPKWAINGRLYKVTHWMPLPEPPLDGGAEDV